MSQLAAERNAETHRAAEELAQGAFPNSPIAAVERGFAEHAGERLQPFGFTFSDRVELLNSAERLGISRFRANMILALHEHRAGTTRFLKPVPPPQPFAPSFLSILIVELLVVGFVAWACMC